MLYFQICQKLANEVKFMWEELELLILITSSRLRISSIGSWEDKESVEEIGDTCTCCVEEGVERVGSHSRLMEGGGCCVKGMESSVRAGGCCMGTGPEGGSDDRRLWR